MIAEEEAIIESSPKSLPLHIEDAVSHPQEETSSSSHSREIKSNHHGETKHEEVTKPNPKDDMESSPEVEIKSKPQKEIKSSAPHEDIKTTNGSDDHHSQQLLSQNDSYFLAKVIIVFRNSPNLLGQKHGLCVLVFIRLCTRLMLKRQEN